MDCSYDSRMTNLPHGLVHLLFVTIHLCERPNLCHVDILAVTEGNYLVERKDEIKCVIQHILFVKLLTILWDLVWGGREGGGERGGRG